MPTLLIVFIRSDQGVTAIEYGLITALIAVVIVTAVGSVGGKVLELFASVDAGLP